MDSALSLGTCTSAAIENPTAVKKAANWLYRPHLYVTRLCNASSLRRTRLSSRCRAWFASRYSFFFAGSSVFGSTCPACSASENLLQTSWSLGSLVEVGGDRRKIHCDIRPRLDLPEHLFGRLLEERGLVRRSADREAKELDEGRVRVDGRRQVVEPDSHQARVGAQVLPLQPALDLAAMEVGAQGQHRLQRLDHRHGQRADSRDQDRHPSHVAGHGFQRAGNLLDTVHGSLPVSDFPDCARPPYRCNEAA